MRLPRSTALMTLLLAACGGGEPPPVPRAAPAAAAPPPAAVPAAAADLMVRGTIRMMPGPMFRSCDASELRPLIDSTGDRIPMYYRATRATDEGGLYVEGRAAGGGGSALVLKSIELVTRAGDAYSCDRPSPTWLIRASGENPGWSLTVTSTGLTFEQPDSAVRINFPATAPQDNGNVLSYSVTDGGHSLHLQVQPGGCNLGRNASWTSMQAQLELDGKSYTGCASRGTQH